MRPIRGSIELRNVCFRYAEAEPLILNNVNLCVAPGQFVTIMGPSGCGKTTLVKIMLGLLEPTSGEVLIDGLPLGQIGPRVYREHIGAVMQEDQLLSGSIADNICFFETTFDQQWMIECAQIAGICDDIMAMPMSYNSLIGDMGSSLSSGQKQRVLLARALYRRPKILFLDEGTAHLDTDKEKEINANLQQLHMTRVSIAHRPEIAHGADMIIRLPAARPLQVGVTGRRPAAAPARDAGLKLPPKVRNRTRSRRATTTAPMTAAKAVIRMPRRPTARKMARASTPSTMVAGRTPRTTTASRTRTTASRRSTIATPSRLTTAARATPIVTRAKRWPGSTSHDDFGSHGPDHSEDMQGSAH